MSHHICPVCASAMTADKIHGWLFACPRCGFLSSTLNVDISSAPSQPQKAINEQARQTALKDLRQKNFAGILNALQKFISSSPNHSLCDVGCAHGWFLGMAAQRGYAATGIEPDGEMAAIATQTGANILVGFFPNVLSPESTFDVITFNDVLEHLPDIKGQLCAAASHLADGGLLVVNGPSSAGILYRIAALLNAFGMRKPFLRMWQHGFPSPHLSYFSPGHLRRITRELGLEEVFCQRLEAINTRGLWQRLTYDRSANIFVSLMAFAGITVLSPFLALFPADINVQIFRKIRHV
ncbi:MAG TPA: class I SAM-dependent methyltransferase [Thermoflexales bacterium]|nr:class I SAM-dependent methyltransferase [Thermoflexales bacterium]HQZ21258.1 class I SAM-dependent methyltransferase [Thermoflexales bacterium]HQZ98692.1 class I SAM-dependent methyltransferase [Thermoflexales bacterium]